MRIVNKSCYILAVIYGLIWAVYLMIRMIGSHDSWFKMMIMTNIFYSNFKTEYTIVISYEIVKSRQTKILGAYIHMLYYC